MPKFNGTHEETLTIDAPMDDVVALMCHPSEFKAFFNDLEHHEEVEEGTWRWVLTEKNEKGVRFKADYTVKYDFNGEDRLAWKTVSDGNMTSEGTASFSKLGQKTRVVYRETIVCDMDVNRLLAKVIKPIVNREIEKGVGGYLQRVKDHLEKSS